MQEVVSVNSSAISTVKYDNDSSILTIVFNWGGEYDYPLVPRSEFENLVNAESVGRYFNQHIKGYSVTRS